MAVPQSESKGTTRRGFFKLAAAAGAAFLGGIGIGTATQPKGEAERMQEIRGTTPNIISPDHLPKNEATMTALAQEAPAIPTTQPEASPTKPLWERPAIPPESVPTPQPNVPAMKFKST
ncbi:MAG: hypothetical protein CEO21_10 [Microgenomates group bacterium Gr01-1014_80]|nr:MAG: hypothetical protein CEO21_10 [Microgenomates group bacterium Gr01-1014_80]